MENLVFMKIKKILIVTSKDSWILERKSKFKIKGVKTSFITDHNHIKKNSYTVFYLGYTKIVPDEILKKNRYNLVSHGSDLPNGRGFAPYTWDILKKKNFITITLFKILNCKDPVDSGPIFSKIKIKLDGTELISEIRDMIVNAMIKQISTFLNSKTKNFKAQKGKATYFRKRSPVDSKINLNKKFKDLIPLLRVVDNERYPAFFEYKKKKYLLKIFKIN